MKTTLKNELQKAFNETGDDFNKIICFSDQLDLEYDVDLADEIEPFTAWGNNYVYFPNYDDYIEDVCNMTVCYAPRNPPEKEKTDEFC